MGTKSGKIMDKYKGNDNHGKPKKDFLIKLSEMNEKQLFDKTEMLIWLSAYANNNPRSDYHWQCDACYDECKKRNRIDIYEKAWRKASES